LFDLENRTLTFAGKESTIARWEVWFQTPVGLMTTLTDALNACTQNDFPPNQVIVPVPVAVDADGRYEIIIRA